MTKSARLKILLSGLLQPGGVGLVFLVPAILINAGNVCAYLFQMVAGRVLDVAEFGAFNALFSATLICLAPANVLPLVVAQTAIEARNEPGAERRILERCLALTALCALGFALIVLIAGKPIAASFDVDRWALSFAFAAVLGTILSLITVGLLQARRRYLAAAFVTAGNPFLRFALGLPLLAFFGLGLSGAMASVALPLFLTFALGLYYLRNLFSAPARALPGQMVNTLRRTAGWQLAVVTLLTAFPNIDIVVGKFILTPENSGLYAGAAIVSRIALLLPAALASIIFTEAAHSHEGEASTPETRRSALIGIGLTVSLAGGLALVFGLFAELIITVLLGEAFIGAAPILRLTAAAMATLSVTQAIIMLLAGRRRFGSLVPLVLAVALMICVPPFFELQAGEIAIMVLTVNLVLLAIAVSALVALFRKDKRRQSS